MKKFKTDTYTDIGTKKDVNQDALVLKQASVRGIGNVCFGCLCDGMGGLSCGEIASAAFIHRMDEWFNVQLPYLFTRTDFTEQLDIESIHSNIYLRQVKKDWSAIVQEMNLRLKNYGNNLAIKLGTTVVAILLINDEYLIMNVGDSRAYLISDYESRVLTHDHSYVQQQIDLGNMTEEEANNSNKKSLLLQCIGASEQVIPSFYSGNCNPSDKILLCSDGFWRKLDIEEMKNTAKKKNGLETMTKMVIERGETDNISSLLIAT
ncbi:Serine/threonine protein phosphatase PrpC [Pseudobutyrivibrio sp. YE44]|uniref:PP2C family protein-serine/threonine phosphatase n=1 Tax=Pseudobutyrivibrio sp. YE44 TaxID=1520802 RepID=UPI0008927275|nr:PP2C family serine/threonine-protein phosphatase [Pseudobutyrivibrio sp. YE44]SDB51867.1 Serine/threonine protein phosphatase PrpC [Pseudobutyrivibrio sp. YE44]